MRHVAEHTLEEIGGIKPEHEDALMAECLEGNE